MTTVEINDIRGNLLNSVVIPDDTPKKQKVKVALEKLVYLNINLEGAILRKANLYEANLEKANLKRVNLLGANLERANLKGADLRGANLEKANLYRANLDETSLDETNLQGANLEGATIKRDTYLLKDGYFTVTNIGSESGTLEIFNTEVGLYFRRKYFFGNEEEFRAEITDKHGNSNYAKAYLHLIVVAKLRFNLN